MKFEIYIVTEEKQTETRQHEESIVDTCGFWAAEMAALRITGFLAAAAANARFSGFFAASKSAFAAANDVDESGNLCLKNS